jgi:hypothetical protein
VLLPERTSILKRWGLVLFVALLAGCAAPPAPMPAQPEGWHAVPLPGKAETAYAWGTKEGRPALAASSDRSASLWRRKVVVPAQQLGEVSFSWWVPEVLAGASVADTAREDSSVRVVFAFGGDMAKLSMRNRALFELAETLTGEMPPYATLMYVWDARAEVGSVVVNSRTDRVRKIVVDAGSEGLREWRDHRRDLVADFRRAFGEDPGPLQSIAVMTDTDNTGTSARAWYGEITLHGSR